MAKQIYYARAPVPDPQKTEVTPAPTRAESTHATGGIYSSLASTTVASDIQKLIACESHGKNVSVIDSNGKLSQGILMFQQSTWDDFSALSGIQGSPMNEGDAIRMAAWAIEHGYLGRWTCAHILGLVS